MSVADCAEFGCEGCVNRGANAGFSKNCGWCARVNGAAGEGDCVPKANAAQCKSGALAFDEAVCTMAQGTGAGTTAAGVPCNQVAVDFCRTSCPKQMFLTCECPENPSSAVFTCSESALTPGIIAGIAIGGVVVIVVLVGLVYYLAKPASTDVVVVDKSGKKIKVPRQVAPAGADGSQLLSQRSAAQQTGNPGPDGLWYCSVSGDANCNRAYMSADELNLHIQKRHPNVSLPPLSVANPSFDGGGGGPPPMLGQFQSATSFPVLQTGTSMPADLGGIFKCQFPGCNRGYMLESDLLTHIQFRHAGGSLAGAPDGASFRPNNGMGSGGSWDGGSGNMF